MKPSFRVSGTIFLGFSIPLYAFAGSNRAIPQQQTEPKIARANAEEASPNSAEGLQGVLNNLLLTARNDDGAKLRTQIADMEIPNYESWFTHMVGQEKGQALASGYGKFLKSNQNQFEMLWVELAKQDGQISIEKVDSVKKYGALADPLDEYRATWKKTDSSAGPPTQWIGVFDFVEGKFRLIELPHQVRILSTDKAGAPSLGGLDRISPAKLINRVPPVYPALARQGRIQGMVALNVVIQKDGIVTIENVGAGHPLLAPAAVAAVKQWRYEPTKLNGDPVDVETKIYVTFALDRQQAEQKQ